MVKYTELRINRQYNYEQFKNIKEKWRLSTFYPFSSGAGKPGLVWSTAFENYNKVVIGKMGKGKGYHKNNCTL